MSTNNREIDDLLQEVRSHISNPESGLGEQLFLFATELTPMVNVDLLIRDSQNRILLSWRKDVFYEEGWHVPGGVVRLKETFENRIAEVGKNEIGCDCIIHKELPTEIVPIICPEMKQRGHFVSLVYECSLPEGFEIHNEVNEGEAGYLKWFERCPEDLISVHNFYKKYWSV